MEDLYKSIDSTIEVLRCELSDHNFSLVYTCIKDLEILTKAYELVNYDVISDPE
jgi:hypothetical protein